MIHETIPAIITAFVISALLCLIIILFLHKLKFGQQIREGGPQVHLKKQRTPTMGGLIILCSIIITSTFYISSYPEITPILSVTIGFGIIGSLDDRIKIVMERSKDLKSIQKLVGQLITAGIFVWYLLNSGEVGTNMLIPFIGGLDGGKLPSLGILFIPALFFIMLGTNNGVNLIDGLDGPCTSVTIPVVTFLTVVAIGKDMGINPMAGAAVGSLLGFLLFNVYPAKVSMGDIGSLALDGFMTASAYTIRIPLFISIIGPIYLVGVLSVIMQVTYFKRIGGKRIFKMAPIHHHFELCEWSETRVVAVPAIATAILYMVAYLGLQSHVYGEEAN